MKTLFTAFLCIVLAPFSCAQTKPHNDNAALVYWSAIAQMKDFTLTDHQAQHLAAIVRGTAPYDDNEFGKLVEENKPALETMIRGAALPECNWGIEEDLGPDAPVAFVRKARELGHLNLLYAFHLSLHDDMLDTARSLAAGIHFAHDVASGGTLFAAATASTLMQAHLTVVNWVSPKMNAAEKQQIRDALVYVGPQGIDWRGNTVNELHGIKTALDELAAAKDQRAKYEQWFGQAPPVRFHGVTTEDYAALEHMQPLWMAMLSQSGASPAPVEDARKNAPDLIQQIVPSPSRINSYRSDLIEALAETKSKL